MTAHHQGTETPRGNDGTALPAPTRHAHASVSMAPVCPVFTSGAHPCMPLAPLDRPVRDRERVVLAIYPELLERGDDQRAEVALRSAAEGYPFPTNLDRDPPVGGLAPPSQAVRNAPLMADPGKSRRPPPWAKRGICRSSVRAFSQIAVKPPEAKGIFAEL